MRTGKVFLTWTNFCKRNTEIQNCPSQREKRESFLSDTWGGKKFWFQNLKKKLANNLCRYLLKMLPLHALYHHNLPVIEGFMIVWHGNTGQLSSYSSKSSKMTFQQSRNRAKETARSSREPSQMDDEEMPWGIEARHSSHFGGRMAKARRFDITLRMWYAASMGIWSEVNWTLRLFHFNMEIQA